MAGDGPAQQPAPPAAAEPEDESIYKSDSFRMQCMKVLPCSKRFVHDWTECPFAHPQEKAKRRDPRVYSYTGIACPSMKKEGSCAFGDHCPYAHNVFEYWLHPTRYRTQLCNDGSNCKRKICFFAHSLDELRVPACKPFVSPEALAAAAAAAASDTEAKRKAATVGSPLSAGGAQMGTYSLDSIGASPPQLADVRSSAPASISGAAAFAEIADARRHSANATPTETVQGALQQLQGAGFTSQDQQIVELVTSMLAQDRISPAQAASLLQQMLPPQSLQSLQVQLTSPRPSLDEMYRCHSDPSGLLRSSALGGPVPDMGQRSSLDSRLPPGAPMGSASSGGFGMGGTPRRATAAAAAAAGGLFSQDAAAAGAALMAAQQLQQQQATAVAVAQQRLSFEQAAALQAAQSMGLNMSSGDYDSARRSSMESNRSSFDSAFYARMIWAQQQLQQQHEAAAAKAEGGDSPSPTGLWDLTRMSFDTARPSMDTARSSMDYATPRGSLDAGFQQYQGQGPPAYPPQYWQQLPPVPEQFPMINTPNPWAGRVSGDLSTDMGRLSFDARPPVASSAQTLLGANPFAPTAPRLSDPYASSFFSTSADASPSAAGGVVLPPEAVNAPPFQPGASRRSASLPAEGSGSTPPLPSRSPSDHANAGEVEAAAMAAAQQVLGGTMYQRMGP